MASSRRAAAWRAPKSCALRARSPSSAWMSSKRAFRPPRAATGKACNAVAREVQGAVICGLARCNARGHRACRAGAAAMRRAIACTCSSPPARSIGSTSSTWRRMRSCGAPLRRCASRATCARTWSSRPRMLRAPSLNFSPRSSRPSSMPAPPPSTYPTPSAIPCRMSLPSSSAICARTCAASSALRSPCTAMTIWAWRLPTASRRWSPARARSSARSTASASAPATVHSRRSSWR